MSSQMNHLLSDCIMARSRSPATATVEIREYALPEPEDIEVEMDEGESVAFLCVHRFFVCIP